LFRLVPSTRPIEEIDFGLWQTPVADDAVNRAKGKINSRGEPKLSGQVKAMWPTPMAHEARLGYQRRMGDAKGTQKSLTTEAIDALGLGENITGSRVQTEKPGALNPQFVCWLMGFPPEWDDCAPMEMPSSRKSRRKS
jgi:hypothetical protein